MSRENLINSILQCKACSARKECLNPVPFEGRESGSDLMIVGRNPGDVEDRLGRPFVGQAGHVLDAGLEYVGIRRSEVFITNLCKCKTKDNRNLRKEEAKTCFNLFLRKEFELVKPKVVLILGAQPNYFLCGINKVSEYNGNVFKFLFIRLLFVIIEKLI